MSEKENRIEKLSTEIVNNLARLDMKYTFTTAEHDEMLDNIRKLHEAAKQPIDMLLFCPNCNNQHIDEPQPEKNWDNPPHRSHECQYCNHVWRPADVPTNGVAFIKTKGRFDKSSQPTQHYFQKKYLEWRDCMIETSRMLGREVSPDAYDISISASFVLGVNDLEAEIKRLKSLKLEDKANA